jgi:hypothetical protein
MSTKRIFRPSLTRRVFVPLAAATLLTLGGCVAYPAYGPGYNGGGYASGGYYEPGYTYAPPVVVAPVVVGGYRGGYYGGNHGPR